MIGNGHAEGAGRVRFRSVVWDQDDALRYWGAWGLGLRVRVEGLEPGVWLLVLFEIKMMLSGMGRFKV
jgi:hypothetical protein